MINSYLISCTVSKLRLIICQIFASDRKALHFNALAGGSVCISGPLWQIRIFGLFFTPNPDIRILSGFFVQVYIGPYIYCFAIL